MIKEKKIVVFASGSGTNFINLNSNITNGKIILLISNNPKCGAIKYAKKNNICYKILNNFRFPDMNVLNQEYENILKELNPDLILLAGFMKKIPDNIINLFNNKIMNIHPSILPKYGGKGYFGIKVHEAVIKSGDKKTGVTVHFINNEYDKGPIILQEFVNVKKTDNPESLAKRVLKKEYSIFLKAVDLFCKDKIVVKNNKVKINDEN